MTGLSECVKSVGSIPQSDNYEASQVSAHQGEELSQKGKKYKSTARKKQNDVNNEDDQLMKEARAVLQTPKDDCDVFGHFVAAEVREILYQDRRERLKRTIQKAIIAIGEEEDYEHFLSVPQQAPPGTKQVVTPPPVKKTLPQVSQPSPKPAIVKPVPPRPVSPPQPPPPPPEVCLRWNSYHSNMQATFPSLLNNEQFVDVTLACEGRSIKCHKMMLSACSSYFEELLSQNPCQHPIVLMKDLKFWEVQALVDFMYRGEVNVGQDKLPSLLAAAEALQIKGLAGPASTSSSHDEDSLPPTLPLATDDYLDESTSSPSSARRARKRRTIAAMPTPRQNTISPHRNPVGRPRLVRPSPQPSTSTYHHSSVTSEPPIRRARRSEPTSLPVGEIKIEPVDIDISNDSMDPIDDGFDLNKSFDGSGGGGDDSSRRGDDAGGGAGGGDEREIRGNLSDDNKAIISGHDSDHMEYGNNNGMNSEATVTATGGESNTEIQGYSYAEGSTDDPGMSSDLNPTYPEVVLNPGADSASSDSILGHL